MTREEKDLIREAERWEKWSGSSSLAARLLHSLRNAIQDRDSNSQRILDLSMESARRAHEIREAVPHHMRLWKPLDAVTALTKEWQEFKGRNYDLYYSPVSVEPKVPVRSETDPVSVADAGDLQEVRAVEK